MPPIKPRVRDDVAVVEIDGELVVYDERNGELHHLNPSASLVFQLLDGTATMRELAGEIARTADASPERVEAEIRMVQRYLRRAGLLDGNGR
jgi:PqqD family protein of HPr-rel-A system